MKSNKKIAIVIHRIGKEIVGGSENYAYKLASILSERAKVDIISTCAKDHLTWENDYPKGKEKISSNLEIIRFENTIKRNKYWAELDYSLMYYPRYDEVSDEERESIQNRINNFPIRLAEDWMKNQGPYAPKLYKYLKKNEDKYDYFVFFTYLYPTTFFGVDQITDKNKVFIIPTFHDETRAYLPIIKKYRIFKHLFLTKEEQRLAIESIYKQSCRGTILGYGLEENRSKLSQSKIKGKYILYAGRMETGKGLEKLLEYFDKYNEEHNRDLKLVLIGKGKMEIRERPMVKYLGFVSEKEKIQLMKDALAFVHPSSNESLGIVLLEAFMLGTPCLVNVHSQVLTDHVQKAEAGLTFRNYSEFGFCLNYFLDDEKALSLMKKNARKYYKKEYSMKAFKKKLFSIFKLDLKKNF